MSYKCWNIRTCLGLILILFQTTLAKAQTSNVIQELYSLNGNGIDWINEVVPLQNGGWILAGYSTSTDLESENSGKWDGLVICLNVDFEPIWNKQFGGAWNDAFTDAIVVNDGIVLCGYKSADKLNKDGWLIKLDFEGKIIWENHYKGTGDDQLFGIDYLQEESYLVCGWTSSDSLLTTFSSTKTDGIVLRIESDGTLSWIKRFTGISNDLLVDIAVGSNGRIYASGFSDSWENNDVDKGTKSNDFWCISLSEDGQEQWSNSYGSIYQEHLTSMSVSGNSILLSGGQRGTGKQSATSYSMYAATIDTTGKLIYDNQSFPNSISFDGIIVDDGAIEVGYKTEVDSHKTISQIYVVKFQNDKISSYNLPPIEGKILCVTEYEDSYILGTVVSSSDLTEEIRIFGIKKAQLLNSLNKK